MYAQVVSHQGGDIIIKIEVPVSFHTPSLFEALTKNVYSLSLKFV